MAHTATIDFSHHAADRLRSRGVAPSTVGVLLDYFDRDVTVGGGCTAYSLSREGLRVARAEGVPGAVVERIANLIVVLGGARCVTVMHPTGQRARRYRRAISTSRPANSH